VSLEEQLLQVCREQRGCGRPAVLGLNGPVGAGKTTFARRLQQHCAEAGLRLAVASIDDAYLPWGERLQAMTGNPYGVTRVPPGSHDPALLCRCVDRWRNAGGGCLQLPRFDKTLREGEGDRAVDWQGEADALLLEGWLLGCRPLDPGLAERALAERPGGLDAAERAWALRCNGALDAYQPLWSRLDQLVQLWPQRWELPRRWRFQAEARQRRFGGGWLSGRALNRLVDASIKSLPPALYQEPVLAHASWVRLLDGRRRCVWEGSGGAAFLRLTQP
jgi:D-glycerate 3-kinase